MDEDSVFIDVFIKGIKIIVVPVAATVSEHGLEAVDARMVGVVEADRDLIRSRLLCLKDDKELKGITRVIVLDRIEPREEDSLTLG